MDKKTQIIALLKKLKNKKISKSLMEKLDSMRKEDLDNVYLLLTVDSKEKIVEIAKKNEKRMKKEYKEFHNIILKIKKLLIQFEEKKQQMKDEEVANSLFTQKNVC